MGAVDPRRLSIALLHYPVLNREGREVATSTVSLDLHDLARLARSYGLFAFYTVTPLTSQRALAGRITDYWEQGYGRVFNPTRFDALRTMRVAESLEQAVIDLGAACGQEPLLIGTSARPWAGAISFAELRRRLAAAADHSLLLFGTGYGLTAEVLGRSAYVLEPIQPGSDYNHLSVRSAAGIVVDRLLGS